MECRKTYNYPIGNDIPITWRIKRFESSEDLSRAVSLKLQMIGSNGIAINVTGYTLDGNAISWIFRGKDQTTPASYVFKLVGNEGLDNMFTVKTCAVLRLVPAVCMSDNPNGVLPLDITSEIVVPSNGLSAYEIAVLHGFKGTEEKWLESLKGEKGDAFTYSDFTPEQIADLKKPAVDAAKAATDAAETATEAAKTADDAAESADEAARSATDAATDAASAASKANNAASVATAAGEAALTAAGNAASAAKAASDTNTQIQTAEQQRASAEQGRVSAEQTRQTEFAQIKQQAETATNAANTAAAAANEAAENIEQSLSEKQDNMDESLQTVDKTVVGAINELLSSGNVSGEVIAQALAELYAKVRGLGSVVDNMGRLRARRLTLDNFPEICDTPMYSSGEGAPSVPPEVPFQEYYDITNKKFYKAQGELPDTPTTANWIAIN